MQGEQDRSVHDQAACRPARRFRLGMDPTGRFILAEQERDKAEADLAAARAESEALRAAGDELTKHLDHDNSDCAPMYGCFCGCLEALQAWRALARPERGS